MIWLADSCDNTSDRKTERIQLARELFIRAKRAANLSERSRCSIRLVDDVTSLVDFQSIRKELFVAAASKRGSRLKKCRRAVSSVCARAREGYVCRSCACKFRATKCATFRRGARPIDREPSIEWWGRQVARFVAASASVNATKSYGGGAQWAAGGKKRLSGLVAAATEARFARNCCRAEAQKAAILVDILRSSDALASVCEQQNTQSADGTRLKNRAAAASGYVKRAAAFSPGWLRIQISRQLSSW